MKSIIVFKRMAALLLCLAALSSMKPVISGALIHASVTGRVWSVNRYHGNIVRFTIRDDGWPNALHDIVIRPETNIFVRSERGKRTSANTLYKGKRVRAEGGVTTFGNRIVADKIILL